jgi:hypothetical protein
MRDRETDSWWSIMTSDAIGGEMNGADLVELPVGEKTTWGDWVSRHPESQVLSVNGVEHDPVDHYDSYFSSSDTFRGLKIKDRRLQPKDSIFTFRLEGDSYAIPHTSINGTRLFEIPEQGQALLVFREPGISMFASSEAYLVTSDLAGDAVDLAQLLAKARRGGGDGISKIAGVDTFWYTWISANKDSKLLQ